MQEIVRSDEALPAQPTATSSGLPAYGDVMCRLARQPWAADLRQIPATVIDLGVLCSVPYKSQRVAEDCEINVYGDPDSPAAGGRSACKASISMTTSSRRCIEFMAALLPALKTDLLAMNRQQSVWECRRLDAGSRPATAADAYHAWWISAYNRSELEKARAAAAELAEVTEAHRAYVAAHPPARPVPKPKPAAKPKWWTRPGPPTTSVTPDP